MKPRIKTKRIEKAGKRPSAFHASNHWDNHAQDIPEIDREPVFHTRSTGCWVTAGNYRGARVLPVVGSGKEVFRDRRHPDLKPKRGKNNTAGFPFNVVRKYK
jgi:hypothetical protein